MLNTSASFHQSNEASDIHADRGHHRQRTLAYEAGGLVPITEPDLPAQIDALNSWYDPDETANGSGFAQAATALKRLILWTIQADADRPRHLSSIARRVVCLSFVVAGDSIPWKSLQEAATEFKCTKQSLGKYSREILELANGNFQRSGMFRSLESRQKRAESTRRIWDRRGRLASAEKRRAAASRARQAKLSRKNTFSTPKTA